MKILQIPPLKLKNIKGKLQKINNIINSNNYILGREVESFEKTFLILSEPNMQ